MFHNFVFRCKITAFVAHKCSVFLHICTSVWWISPHEASLSYLCLLSRIYSGILVFPPLFCFASGLAIFSPFLFATVGCPALRGPRNARGVMGCTLRFRPQVNPHLYTLHFTPRGIAVQSGLPRAAWASGKSGGIGRPNADGVSSQCDPIAEREC